MHAIFQQAWQRFLARRHPIAPLSLTLTHQRIYILPSRQGLGFLVLILLSLIGAINYQLSLGFMFAFLLIGMAAAALLHTYANLLGLQMRSTHADPVFAGDAARFPLIFADHQGRSRQGITLCANSLAIEQSLDIAPYQETRHDLMIPTQQRGYLSLPRSRLECRTPTAWFVAWSYITLASECLVYPQPEKNPPPLPFDAPATQQGLGFTQGDEDFAGLRAYQMGDSPRHIAWKQVASTEQMLSKAFHSPLASEVVLDWSTLHGLHSEARLSRLCAWVLQAEAAGHRYALRLPGTPELALHRGLAHQEACLAALALFPADGAR